MTGRPTLGAVLRALVEALAVLPALVTAIRELVSELVHLTETLQDTAGRSYDR